MSFQPNDDLQRAKEAVTIFQLWERAGLPGIAPDKDGIYLSPFRQEKTPSFSISKHGKVWADFGDSGANKKGGVWEFAARCPCWAQLDNGGIAKALIETSGIIPTIPTKATPAAAGAPVEAPVVDERLLRAAKSIDRRARISAREDAVYEELEKKLLPPSPKYAPAWPACVRARYLEGVVALIGRGRYLTELAADRGWPVEWVHELVAQELISFPWERWAEPEGKFAKRQKAFAVMAPRIARDGVVTLDPIGYHQRFYVPPGNGVPEKKGWLYLPSLPRGQAFSKFEQEILEAARSRGVKIEDRPSLVPPVPFVLGDIQNAKLAVLLEGQWDAITFFGACGWFSDSNPPQGVAVFGIRGAQGIDAFLGHWAPWLEKLKPRVWVLADNDAAGGSWRDAPPAEPGLPRPPSFAERLAAAGCRAPLISWLKPGPWGKDFNDYFRARTAGGKPLSPDKMQAWLRQACLVDGKGAWL